MLNEIALFRGWLFLFFTVTAIAGCGDAATYPASGADPALNAQTASGAAVLRGREDPRRKRRWVLALDEIRVYDTAVKPLRLIRKIALPRWSVISFRYVCMPDMVLDNAGSAFISSNAEARLLRIDADSFALRDYDIHFPAYVARDSGFGALAFAPNGTLLARTAMDGLLWKIDISTATAIMIANSPKTPSDACSITSQHLNHFARNPHR